MAVAAASVITTSQKKIKSKKHTDPIRSEIAEKKKKKYFKY